MDSSPSVTYQDERRPEVRVLVVWTAAILISVVTQPDLRFSPSLCLGHRLGNTPTSRALISSAPVLIESAHQKRSCLVVDPPQTHKEAPSSRLKERVGEAHIDLPPVLVPLLEVGYRRGVPVHAVLKSRFIPLTPSAEAICAGDLLAY